MEVHWNTVLPKGPKSDPATRHGRDLDHTEPGENTFWMLSNKVQEVRLTSPITQQKKEKKHKRSINEPQQHIGEEETKYLTV